LRFFNDFFGAMMKKIKNEHIAFFAAFLFPGAGHLYAGKYTKALVLAGALSSLFILGIYLNGEPFPISDNTAFSASLQAYQLIVDKWANYLLYVVHFLIFLPALGVYTFGLSMGDTAARFSEVGNTLFLLAGVLNLLAMFSAADTIRENNYIIRYPDEWERLCKESCAPGSDKKGQTGSLNNDSGPAKNEVSNG
jgi:hypothetical protein